MKGFFLTSTLISILFLSACGDSDEITEQIEDDTEQAIENNNLTKENQQTEKDELADDETESSAEKLQKSTNSENNPSDDQITILENKYDSMTRDGFIESIDAQNDEYTEIIIYVSDKFDAINEKGYRSKLEGIGKSIREMTSGILYNKEQGTLPLIEFRDNENNFIAKFETHTRDARIVFEK